MYKYKQILATFHGCKVDLTDEESFLKTSLEAIKRARMELARTGGENPLHYKVDDDAMGGGVSINALIVTSHLTIHTSKKYNSVEFDCATCGEDSAPEEALKVFMDFLKAERVEIRYKNF